MGKLPPVICRAEECKGIIDRNTQVEGIDWMKDPDRKGWYWHVHCYEAKQSFIQNPRINNEVTDAMWFDACWDFLTKVQKIDIDFVKFKSQFENFLKKKETAKGIYFTLRYFYDVQKGDKSKADGGIGIVPFVYRAATEYWTNLEISKAGIIAEIESQIARREARPVVYIQRPRKKKKKEKWDLNSFTEEENG